MNVLDKSVCVKPVTLECDICGAQVDPLEVVQLPDFGGAFDACCPACAASERFFETLEREATAWFVRLVADVPESLKPLILATLGHAVTGAEMTTDAPQKRVPRRVPFTAALESGQPFGRELLALGLMPNPRAAVSADGVFLEVSAVSPSSADPEAVVS
jgi:hypothetical protein